MPMDREEHENLLNELNNPELEHTRRSEILQQLRTDYTGVHTDFEAITTERDKFKGDNLDLVVANSKLFRQLGKFETGKEDEVKEKDFSESITIESLERG
jgi:hypothetical protein